MAQRITPTAWVGWAYFAAVMLMAVGGMQIITGLVGVFNESFYTVTSGLIAFDYPTWGWINITLGSIALLTGIGVLVGSRIARVIAVFVTVVAMISNLAFVSAYPIWSLVALLINGLVIYALTIHGNELEL